MKRFYIFAFIIIFTFPKCLLANNFAVMISSKVTLYSQKDESSKKIIFNENIFGKSFSIVSEDSNFIEIETRENQHAYINKGSPILVSKGRKEILSLRLEGSKIFRKALIVNKPTKSGKPETDISYYDNDNCSGKQIGKTSIFEIRYIFSESDKSYLVGRSNVLESDTSDSIIVGWIDKTHVIEWENLIGIEFDKTNYQNRKNCEIGKIFSYEDELFKKNSQPIYFESNTPDELPYYANRFPVIEKNKDSNSYKFAYIGNAYGKEGKTYGRKEIEKAKKKITDILNSDSVQLAILLDATKGMEKHIINVKKAVRSFLNDMSNNKGIKAGIAICVYRDYPDGDKIYEVKIDFSQDIDQLNKAIDSIKVYSNKNDRGIGAYPEAMFYGIDKTMEKLSWNKPPKGGQYILLIGDHGNHKDYSQYPEDKMFNAPAIGEKLKRKIITLYALQVNINKNKKVYNDMFENQILDIRQNNHGLGGIVKVYSNSANAINSGLKDAVNNFSVIKEALRVVRDSVSETGQSGETENSIYRGVFTQKLLERYNIDADLFRAIQICDIGYAKSGNKCGDNQFFEKVLMTRRDLEALKVQIQEISDAALYYDPESEGTFQNVIFLVVKALTGDKLAPNENIAEFIEKKSGVPITTQLLNMTLEQLLDKIRSKEFRLSLRKYLEEKIMLLDGFIREKQIKNIEWDQEDQRFIYNINKDEVPYFFSLELPIRDRGKNLIKDSKKIHAWVPLEYLP